MREGSSLRDFEHPPFVIVGCDTEATADVLRELYARVDAPFVKTTVRTAEMVKYVCNAFHALKICFANEMADLCDVLGADAQEVMRIFRLDRKLNISEAYLKPGFAFGGSCLPKDVRALVSVGRLQNLQLPLVASIMPANENQVLRSVGAVMAAGRRRVGIVGLAFKPGIDDLRESPMVALVERLIGKGYDVRVLDSSVSLTCLVGANRRYVESEIPHIASLLCDTVEELVAHADLLILSAASEDGVRAARLAGPEQTIVDLTRGAVSGLETRPVGVEECVAR
jgi:GDP-mannose 6-dehydrogenase